MPKIGGFMKIEGKQYKDLSDTIANVSSEIWHVRSHHPELEDDGCLRMLEDSHRRLHEAWKACQEKEE